MSIQVLNTSNHRESTAFLVVHSSIWLPLCKKIIIKKNPNISHQNFLYSNLCMLTLFLLLYITKKSLVSFFSVPYFYTHCREQWGLPFPSSSLGWTSPVPSASPCMFCAPALTIMATLHWTHSCMSGSVLCQELKPRLSMQLYQSQAMDQDPFPLVVQPQVWGLFCYLGALLCLGNLLAPGRPGHFCRATLSHQPQLDLFQGWVQTSSVPLPPMGSFPWDLAKQVFEQAKNVLF